MTQDLGFPGHIRRTVPFSHLLRHTRGWGGPFLTRSSTGATKRKVSKHRTKKHNDTNQTENKNKRNAIRPNKNQTNETKSNFTKFNCMTEMLIRKQSTVYRYFTRTRNFAKMLQSVVIFNLHSPFFVILQINFHNI